MKVPQRSFVVIVSVLLLFSTCITSVRAQHFYSENFGRRTNVTCSSFRSSMLDRTIDFSIYLPPGYFDQPARKFPVIYYLHGFDARGLAYEDWLNWYLDEALDDLIAAHQVQEMVVVMPECFETGIVVNWGPEPHGKLPPPLALPYRLLRGAFRSVEDPTYLGSYLFLHRWDLTRANCADFFTTELFRHVEQNYHVETQKRYRALCGFSDGGYSALSLAFQNAHLFDSVSAHAPVLVAGSPFSPNAGELFVQYDAHENRFVPQRFFINLLRRIFGNEETWQSNDPFRLACCRNLEDLSVYVDVADKDKRRNDAGARELADILKVRGVPLHFELVKGLPTNSSHTYPGFLNGKLVASRAKGKSEEELRREFRWEHVGELINPDVQQITHSLMFHSREFSNE